MKSLKDIISEDFTLKSKGKINQIRKGINHIHFEFDLDCEEDMGTEQGIKDHIKETWDDIALSKIDEIKVTVKDTTSGGYDTGWVTFTISIDNDLYEQKCYWNEHKNKFTDFKCEGFGDYEYDGEEIDWTDCYIILDEIYDFYKNK